MCVKYTSCWRILTSLTTVYWSNWSSWTVSRGDPAQESQKKVNLLPGLIISCKGFERGAQSVYLQSCCKVLCHRLLLRNPTGLLDPRVFSLASTYEHRVQVEQHLLQLCDWEKTQETITLQFSFLVSVLVDVPIYKHTHKAVQWSYPSFSNTQPSDLEGLFTSRQEC